MLTKPTISQHLADKSNSELVTYANNIVTAMTGNTNYTTPNPTLIALGTLITAFSDAFTASGAGDVHNRGSHAQIVAVNDTRADLEIALVQLQDYCQTTTPYDEAAFLSGGFAVRPANAPVGIIGMVQNLRQFISRTIPSGAVKLKWKRPLVVKQGAVNSYKVLRALTPDISTAEVIGICTKTTFTDLEAANQPTNFYWVIPVGAAGDGVLSDAVAGYPIGPIAS